MSRSDDEVLQFVTASFPSVWALELLLTLKRDRRPWTRAELVATLRASELVVSKAAEALVAAGLASIEGQAVNYLPVNRDVELWIGEAERLYQTRPNKVRRGIVMASTRAAAAFSDAFKLRRDRDD